MHFQGPSELIREFNPAADARDGERLPALHGEGDHERPRGRDHRPRQDQSVALVRSSDAMRGRMGDLTTRLAKARGRSGWMSKAPRRHSRWLRWFVVGAAVPLASCQRAGILDPQGPIASAERLLLINSTAIMLVVVVPVIVATLAFAWWYRASNTQATRSLDESYEGRLEFVVWSIPALTVILLGGVIWIGSHQLDPRAPIPGKSDPLRVDATDAEIRVIDKTVRADSRVPDFIFYHVEFADRECVDSAKGAPRSAMRSASAVAFALSLRGCRMERPQVTLQLACRLPHAHGGNEEPYLFLQRVIRKRRPQGKRTRVRLRFPTAEASPGKNFFCKNVFVQRLPPLWDRTIFGQVFVRGGMTKF